MEEKIKTLPLLDHPRLRQEFYLHSGPKHAFWELFNGWGMLLDFACAGIFWEHRARIDIDEQDGKCLFRFAGDVSTEKVFKLLNKVIAWKGDAELPIEFPGWVFSNACIGGGDKRGLDTISLMLVIAYSQNVRLRAVYEKQSIEMTLQGDSIKSLEHSQSEEANQWYLDFTPNPQYISEVNIGRAFQRECFRRVCAYSDALSICVRGHEMHEFSGTRTWLELVAPTSPYWRKTANIRVLVPRKFEVAFSFRPGTERRYEIFCAGHISGGQPRQLLENIFESYIAEYYGETALPKIRNLGFVAVLSILGIDDIIRPSMASDDCQIDEDSELQMEIKATLRSTFRDLTSLHDLLKEEYGLVPIE